RGPRRRRRPRRNRGSPGRRGWYDTEDGHEPGRDIHDREFAVGNESGMGPEDRIWAGVGDPGSHHAPTAQGDIDFDEDDADARGGHSDGTHGSASAKSWIRGSPPNGTGPLH